MPTATLVLLFDRTPALADLTSALTGFPTEARSPAPGAAHAISVPAHGGDETTVLVDVFPTRWDDGAGTLERAAQHAYSWPEAAAVAERHTTFVLVTAESPSLAGADPVRAGVQLAVATDAARTLSGIAGTIAYLDSAGEVLLGIERLQKSILLSRAAGVPPLDLWSNVRMFRANQGALVMDTVGMAQLGRVDHEAFIPEGACSANDAAMWLRNLSSLSLRGTEFNEGTRAQGPNGVVFQAKKDVLATNAPARAVFRWLVTAGR